MNGGFADSTPYRILRLVLCIGFWVVLGYAAVSLIALLLFTFVPQVRDQFVTASTLQLDGFTVTLPGGTPNTAYVIGTIGMLAAGFFCIWMLRDIVNSLRTGSPFTAANVKRMRIIGWVVFVESYLDELTKYLMIESIIDNSTLKAQFTLLPSGVFLALLILVLAEIFRYGCTLQQEHDTTV